MSSCSNVLRVPPSAERILVIRLGAMGDVLRTLPAVAALRELYPQSRISWLVEPASAGAVALSPAVDEALLFPRPDLVRSLRSGRVDRLFADLRRVIGTLREGRFDLVIDFHGILKSGLLARSSGASMRVGYARPHAREGSWLLATHRAEIGAEPRSRYARNAGLVEFLGAGATAMETNAPRRACIAVPEIAIRRMAASLGEEAVGVVLHPGTSARTPYKRWSPERFAALARTLSDETGARCLVACGPGKVERQMAREVVARSEGTARLAPPTDELVDLAALLARSPMLIGNDSGPVHLASLVGTPVVQILGPTHPIENAPLASTPNRVVRVPVECSPCRRGCHAPICMDAVPVALVAAAARELLSSRPISRTATASIIPQVSMST